jgi:hypothetical protein
MQPVVRHLIACEDIQRGGSAERFTLVQVISRIRSFGPEPFPLLYPELCVLAICTGCRGQGRVQIRITDEETDGVCHRTPLWSATFGNDPLRIIGFPFRIHNIEFPAPGVYQVQLWYNGLIIAQESLTLSE